MRLLVVDDDALTRHRLRSRLAAVGHQVELAGNGEDAWELLQRDPISLVITDWVMPRVDGPELIRRLRAAPSRRYTYVILLTAKNDKDDVVDGLETGADDYLTKPFYPDELRARVSIGERILNLETRLQESHRQLEESHRQLEILATYDSLTGLLNRRAVQERLKAEWSRMLRGEACLSLLMLDIDYFKAINDQHGHLIGDQAVRLVAERLSARIRPYDWAGRWGGEEFLVVLPATDAERAGIVGERVRRSIAMAPLMLPDGRRVDVRVSVGIASAAPDGPVAGIDALIQQADEALYHAKRDGRDRVCTFTFAPASATAPSPSPPFA